LVTSGLKAGDKLIVEGLNKIGPGMPVHATEIPRPTTAEAPAADAPAPAADAQKPAEAAKPAANPQKPAAQKPAAEH
jgi:hypothetical protein